MRDFSSRPRRDEGSQRLDQALLAVALLALVWVGFRAWATAQDLREARQAAERARQDSGQASVRLRALESAGAGGDLVAEAQKVASAPPTRILADLERLLPGGVRLQSFNLTYAERPTLELRVSARSAAEYDQFLKRLTESPLFGEVAPGEENRDGEVQASLRALYVGAAS